jgi:hypothetical protein
MVFALKAEGAQLGAFSFWAKKKSGRGFLGTTLARHRIFVIYWCCARNLPVCI